jgi:sugar phosphate isomerase/epimerase
MPDIGVAHLSALDLPPIAFARQAAVAGFSAIGLRLNPAMPGGQAYPLRPASAELRELKQVLAGKAIAVADIEFVALLPDIHIPELQWMLEAGAELGARSLTVSGDDPHRPRLIEHFSQLCELAAPYGLRVDLEFMRWREVADLSTAVAVVQGAAKANGAILLDALHLYRSGGDAAKVAALPPGLIAAVQLCDAPRQAPPPELIIQEAREGRLAPGQGELPLAELLAALPGPVAFSVEMPAPQLAVGERLALAYGTTLQLLADVGAIYPRGQQCP